MSVFCGRNQNEVLGLFRSGEEVQVILQPVSDSEETAEETTEHVSCVRRKIHKTLDSR